MPRPTAVPSWSQLLPVMALTSANGWAAWESSSQDSRVAARSLSPRATCLVRMLRANDSDDDLVHRLTLVVP